MTQTAKTVKTIKDHNGYDVPVKSIRPLDLTKNNIAVKMADKFIKSNQMLTELKDWAFKESDKIYEAQLKAYEFEGKQTAAMKGNFTFFSYDKSIKVEVQIGNKMEFDDKINIAKAMIDEYLQDLVKGQSSDVILIVNNAFVTSRGKLDHKKILNLFTLKIKAPKWIAAMEILKESITTNISKRYIKVWQRDDQGEYQIINVQFSAL
ncbi:MAG: DUF3164 family protein [Chitinophagales bacterium]